MSISIKTPVDAKFSNAKDYDLWIVSGLLALLSVASGVGIFATPNMATMFAAWGSRIGFAS